LITGFNNLLCRKTRQILFESILAERLFGDHKTDILSPTWTTFIADEFQTRILIMFVCVSTIFGLWSGSTVLATALGILPWAIYAGLGFSDSFHAARIHRMVRKADSSNRGRRAGGVCEIV